MKQKTRSLLTLLLTIVLGAVLALGVGFMVGCGGESDSDVTITLSKTEAEIVCGESTRIVATVSDGSSVTWSSSNESVATVSTSGQVTGKTAGTSVITAAVGDVTATCTVTVVDVTVTISETSVSIDKGETYQLSATASKSDSVIAWSSSDETIATVDSTGLVTTKKAGTVTITATYGTTSYSASCTVTVVWDAPEGYTEIVFAGETDTFTTYPDQWVYWNDKGWCGSEVTAIEAYTESSGAATFIYEGASTACYYGYQIFYTNTSLTGGAYYKITIVINSAVAGSITISGNVVDLVVGDNTVVIYKTEAAEKSTYGDASIGFQMGVSDGSDSGTVIESNTFVIKSVTWEEQEQTQLSAPTDLSITSAGVVTFTDGNGENTASYLLTFYQNDVQVATQTIENGGTIDQSVLDNGEYTVTVTAVGSGSYTSSVESASFAFTVTEGKVYLEAVTSVAIASNVVTFTDGNSAGVDSYLLTVYLKGYPVYTQTVTNGGTITVGNLENGTYTATVTAVGSGRYVTSDESTAVDYVVTDGTTASGYSFKTVGLSVEDEKLYYIIVGTYSTSDYTAAQIEAYKDVMLFSLRGNPYVLSGQWDGDWVFYTFADTTTISAADGVFTITIDISSLITKTYAYTSYLSFDGTYNGGTATYEEGNIADFTLSINYSISVEFNGYTVTVSSDTSDTGDGFKFWGLVGLTVVSDTAEEEDDDTSTTTGAFVNDGESAAQAAPGNVYYWYVQDEGWSCGPVVAMTEATGEDDTVTLTYTAPEDAYWFAVQVFYVLTEEEAAANTSATVTITSALAGDITVNGVVYSLEAGVAKEITVDLADTNEISIQLGNESESAFLSGTNTVTIICELFEIVEASEETDTTGTLVNGEKSAALATPGTYVYWYDQNWCGSTVTMTTADLTDGVITLTYTSEGLCWYGIQFFYEFTDTEKADATQATLTISSSVAGDVTINDVVYTLEAGVAQTVTVAFTSDADISIQMGNETENTMISAATITISNISCS